MATAFIYRTSPEPADCHWGFFQPGVTESLSQFSHDDEQGADHADEDQHREPDPHPLLGRPVFAAHFGSRFAFFSFASAPPAKLSQVHAGQYIAVPMCPPFVTRLKNARSVIGGG